MSSKKYNYNFSTIKSLIESFRSAFRASSGRGNLGSRCFRLGSIEGVRGK